MQPQSSVDSPQSQSEQQPSKITWFSQWFPGFSAGLMSGVISVLKAISLAALVFSGGLSNQISLGVGIVLMSNVLIRLVVSLTSSYPGVISNPQPEQIAILALIATSIESRMAGTATTEEIVVTVVGAIALTSMLTGAFSLVLGWLKVGELIRFIPYPVVGGFLAGTGWLLLKGAFHMLADVSLTWTQLPDLFTLDVLPHWLSGLGFAIALLLISRRFTQFWVMPALCLGAIALFYGILTATQTSIATASANGWFLADLGSSSGGMWQPITLTALPQMNGGVILDQLGSMAVVVVLTSLSLLLSASALELATDQDIDLNRELKSLGIANLVSGLSGGMPGTHSLSSSVLAYKMGGRNRLTGISAAAIFIVALVLGPFFVAYLPKPIIGGLLLFLGLSLLLEWLFDAWFTLPRADYGVVVLILVFIGVVGFLEGVGVGLIATIILFVLNYSQTRIAKHVLSGSSYTSHVSRPQHQETLIREKGDQVYILELQGFIFFGTANRLLNQIRQRLTDPDLEPLHFVILDFRLVSGLDSSAVLSFVKLKQLGRKQGLRLVFTHLHRRTEKMLRQGGCLEEDDPICQVFADLDRGMEWCEAQILESVTWRRGRFMPLTLQLQRVFSDPDQVAPFTKYLERSQLAAGDWLFRQHTKADSLYFVESGQVSTLLELDRKQTVRVQTLGAGTIVGEIAFYTRTEHETSAIADQSTILYRLSAENLQQMQQDDPQAAAAFQEFMISLLANRLAQSQKEIKNLLL
ncbi:SLC26A/SulP transporter family protein [Oscillatoria sp. FACHB-1407]|uniref:SulP family inorganic anion transporter n=1 Tax=Oscillatoria sp. FACHB-1407 TaxID=2692847 RepID=UPI001685AFA9|nr:SulP family inorganic anion transporter [Oscillatoria sp. FACHB-1407]MBD2462002.1 SLC26A/SulP transporter family protein [Oscillatoria sp. FACHB-1407]